MVVRCDRDEAIGTGTQSNVEGLMDRIRVRQQTVPPQNSFSACSHIFLDLMHRTVEGSYVAS